MRGGGDYRPSGGRIQGGMTREPRGGRRVAMRCTVSRAAPPVPRPARRAPPRPAPGRDRGRLQFLQRHQHARIRTRQQVAQRAARFVEARDQTCGGNAVVGEIRVVGIAHQREMHAERQPRPRRRPAQERPEPRGTARQRGQPRPARDRIEVDVHRQACAASAAPAAPSSARQVMPAAAGMALVSRAAATPTLRADASGEGADRITRGAAARTRWRCRPRWFACMCGDPRWRCVRRSRAPLPPSARSRGPVC